MHKTQLEMNIYPPRIVSGGYWSGLNKVNSTSKVLDEVLQLHLPLGFDVRAVHVSVEEDDGKGQDEDGVGVPELSDHTGVADAVALAVDPKKKSKWLYESFSFQHKKW